MKKKSLLSLLFLLMFFGIAKAETETIQIGSGSSTNLPVPFNPGFYSSYTQQIYQPSEIGKTGTITSIAFYAVNTVDETNPAQTRNLDLFLVETDKSSFSSDTDWLSISESNRVFSGEVTFPVGCWTTITFDTPFEYNGTGNLCVIVYDKTGVSTYEGGIYWLVYQKSYYYTLSWIAISSSETVDLASPPTTSFTNRHTFNNQLQLTFADGGGSGSGETIQVGSGTDTNQGMPIYNNWKYGLTQQIYTSEEIGKTGTITSIAFKAVEDMGMARTIDIYLVKTNKSYFSNAEDYISASESDKVFSGTVPFTEGDWTTIEFDKPFDYDGSTNLCLIVNDKTGSFASSIKKWLVYSSPNQAIFRITDNNGPYDPASPTSLSSGPTPNLKSYKSQLQLTFAESSGTPIHSVYVNGYEPPVAGEKATDHLNITLPSDANYNFETTPYWYNDDAYENFTGTFVAGIHYSLGMRLRANDGYYFADDCTFYLNGSTELVDNAYTLVNSEDNTMAYFWSVSTAATSGGGSSAEVIDFETGDFSQFSFQNDSEYPWIVTNSDAASGTYCMKSGNVGVGNSSSIITATYTFEKDGYIIFDAKCMGEGENTAWDKCIFYIDGEAQFTYGAHNPNSWETYHFTVTAGTHTFKWEYTKDNSVNAQGDAFFVDNIRFGLGEPCVAPYGLEYELTINSATLTWKGYSEYFSLRYRQEGGDWQYVNAITETTYTLTDLAQGVYEVEVQASCNTSTCSGTFEIVGPLSTAEWYAYATYSMDGADWGKTFINFSMQDVSTVQAVSPVLPENWAAAFADGYVWFILSETGDLCRAPLYTETKSLGDYEVVVSGFETEGVAKEMAYNVADGKIYYLIDYNSGTKLKSFSPNDLSNVGGLTFDLVIQAFAINKNGEAYGIEYQTGKLYRINLADGHYALVGETGLAVSFVQSMAFDMETDELFWEIGRAHV